jgi:chromosome segregation ATPase
MGHLPDTSELIQFKRGDPLIAENFNWNFALVHGWAETAMAAAKAPDTLTVEVAATLAPLTRRVTALERREASSERQRNERQYVPLAAHGALVRQMGEIAGPLRQAAAELQAECGTQRAAPEPMERRLAALEAQEQPSMEAFQAVQAGLAKARAEAAIAVGQAVAVRKEMAGLRKQMQALEARLGREAG